MRNQKAFTLVELLIVIVVIAILAGISVVAFNGIVQRSKSTAYISSLTQWEKLLSSYKAVVGDYPSTGGFEICLSASLPAGEGHAVNQCYSQVPAYSLYVNATFNTALSTEVGTLPSTVLPVLRTTDNANGSSAVIRGLMFAYGPGTVAPYIQYFLDSQTSAAGTRCIGSDTVAYTNYQDGSVRCRRMLG